MERLKVLDLFSGIGGFSLGLERTGGFETVAFCEIEDYPRRVLAKHWPNVPIYDDVRELTGERLREDGIAVDVICGGFPCQDISTAGKQGGINAERSGLWSECDRLLGEIQPRWAIFENVTNLLNGGRGDWFKRVLWDISQVGYDAEWHCIPASHLGAPHQRDRIWIIAYPNSIRQQKRKHESSLGDKAPGRVSKGNKDYGIFSENAVTYAERWRCPLGREAGRTRWQRECIPGDGNWQGKDKPVMGREDDGIPFRLDRLKALGNAVVPQIPELIGMAILEAMEPDYLPGTDFSRTEEIYGD